MKRISIITITGFLALNSIVAAETNSVAPSDDLLIRFAQQRTNAVRFTETPVRMSDRVSGSCISPIPSEVTQEQRVGTKNLHFQKYAHVYVSREGTSAKTNTTVFPIGSIVLKEKFSDAEGSKTELFTGMVKRESGYNTACGDWEFFTLSANASKVTSRGKLQSCMACHLEYKESDFVTKEYVPYALRTHQ